MAIGDHAEPPPRRKRARPRFKGKVGLPLFSRSRDRVFYPCTQPDTDTTSTNVGASVSCIHDPPANIYTTSYAFGDESEKGTANTAAAPDDGMNPSLQAVYEDPTQAAERRKLISLLKGAPGQSKIREGRAHRAAAVARPSVPSGRRMAGF